MITQKKKTSSILTNPTLVLMVLLTVLLWLGGVIYIYPKVFEAFDARSQYNDLQDELADVSTKIINVSKYDRSEYARRMDEELIKAMPYETDVPLVIGAAVAVLQDFEMDVVEAKSSSVNAVPGALNSVSIKIGFEGSRGTLDAFLDRLSKVAPIMKGEQMEYTYEGVEEETEKIKVDLGFSTYALAEDKIVAGNNVNEIVVPVLTPDDETLYNKVVELEKVTPVLDLEFLGDENWDPFQPVVR